MIPRDEIAGIGSDGKIEVFFVFGITWKRDILGYHRILS